MTRTPDNRAEMTTAAIKSQHIVAVGGGSAGHVLPALPILDELLIRGWRVTYVGTRSGLEQRLTAQLGLTYRGIFSGKLRRYWSWRNFTDLALIAAGFVQALAMLIADRPQVVFSKGGFVSLPIVVAAGLLRIPVIAHESDLTPGLANRLAAPFLRVLCVSFPETRIPLMRGKTLYAGTPIRRQVLQGDAQRALQRWSLDARPLLLVTGGSLGAAPINEAIRAALPQLLSTYQVVHVCGAGKTIGVDQAGYTELEYIDAGWEDLLAAAAIVISRAGANALFELLALAKLNLLIPLSPKASRSDQVMNAEFAEGLGMSAVLAESELDTKRLMAALAALVAQADTYQAALRTWQRPDTVAIVVTEIEALIRAD